VSDRQWLIGVEKTSKKALRAAEKANGPDDTIVPSDPPFPTTRQGREERDARRVEALID
jgi:hypothetical protein